MQRVETGDVAAASRSRGPATRNVVMANSKKTDMKKQGLSSVKDDVIRNNLMGTSRKMKDKNWTDSQGRKGKVRGGRCARGARLRCSCNALRRAACELGGAPCRASACTALRTSTARTWTATRLSTRPTPGLRPAPSTSWASRASLHGALPARLAVFFLVTSLPGFAWARAVLRLSLLPARPAASHLLCLAALYALLHHPHASQARWCPGKPLPRLHGCGVRALRTRRSATGQTTQVHLEEGLRG